MWVMVGGCNVCACRRRWYESYVWCGVFMLMWRTVVALLEVLLWLLTFGSGEEDRIESKIVTGCLDYLREKVCERPSG
jgi:hypothetical protein